MVKRILEIFCGTKSIGKVFERNGWEVISLDIDPKWEPTICCDILQWDYKSAYPPGYFDVIHASPACTMFSTARLFSLGRHGYTREKINEDIVKYGLPPLLKTLEIIKYFKPDVYLIENPQTGRMKEYLDLPYTDCSYCAYGMKYRKNTRIWNNIGLKLEKCKCKGHHLESILKYQKRDGFPDQIQVNNKFLTYVIPEKLCESIYFQVIEYLEDQNLK